MAEGAAALSLPCSLLSVPARVCIPTLSQCPPCRKFTPMLHTLYDEVNEDGKKLEIIFVSSDKSAEEQGEYMQAMHGDWLRVNFGSDVRGKLKARYGVFAGSEAADFPNVTRRCGIPGLVLFGPNFEELGQYDCDDGGNGEPRFPRLVSCTAQAAHNALPLHRI